MTIVSAGFAIAAAAAEVKPAGFDLFCRTRTQGNDLTVEDERLPGHGRVQVNGHVVVGPFNDIAVDMVAFIVLQRDQTAFFDRKAFGDQAALPCP